MPCWRSEPVDLADPTSTALLASEALAGAGIPHALYGGLLLAAYGEMRNTKDVDLAVVEATPGDVRTALEAAGLEVAIAFEAVTFGGHLLDRLTILGGEGTTGLNVLDLVRPRSPRYRRAALRRSVALTLRGREIRALAPEDFVLFKLLSTRDRDLRDAATALRRIGGLIDVALVRREAGTLASEIPDFDIRGRLAELLRLLDDPGERRLGEGLGGKVHEMTPAQWKRLALPAGARSDGPASTPGAAPPRPRRGRTRRPPRGGGRRRRPSSP